MSVGVAAGENRDTIAELAPVLDAGIGPRGRIGFIALANGYVTEHEVARMIPEDIVLYVNRVASENVVDLANLRLMEGDMIRAASMILPADHIDVLVYGCTSGTIAMGEDAVIESLRTVRPETPITTPITGALAAFDALGAEKVAMLTPYVFEVTAAMRDYFISRGVDVVGAANFNVALNSDIQRITPQAIHDAALEIDVPEADAIFISCTALRTADVIDGIEAALGKPVITSNQALAWHALRLMGYTDPVPGLGRLFTL
jgi:maleate isomerase